MNLIRPFGDHANDGIVQVSFTLPIPCSPASRIAAKLTAEKMGLKNAEVVHEISLNSTTSYFILYGKVECGIDINEIGKLETEYQVYSKGEIEHIVRDELGTDVRVIGASTGTDTHSVGIDAILNHKGYNSHVGLEAYRGFVVKNLGSQVPNEKLIAEAVRMNADVILVSQTVTQQNLHVSNLTALIDMLEAEGLRERFLLICGGPRISSLLAKELGYDAGFSKGAFAEHVASFIVASFLSKSVIEEESICEI